MYIAISKGVQREWSHREPRLQTSEMYSLCIYAYILHLTKVS